MLVIDLKSILYYDHSYTNTKGVVNEYWQNYIFPNNGVLAYARIPKMCQTLSRQLQNAKLFLLRSISVHGIRSVNFSRKPSRHRGVFAFCPKLSLSYWFSRQSFAQYFSTCKRKARLAYLRRLRPNFDQQGPKVVCQRFFRIRSERNSLCTRFLHDRFMSFFVSLGAFSQKKRRDKTSHTFGPERSYPRIHQGYRWFCARCEYLRRSFYRAWRFLHNYPEKLRRIRYFDSETQKYPTFLTNNFSLPAITIAQLYKCRWQVELFFKWIKQHLRIKAFYGTSKNAVKTQVWIAIAIYVLIAIIKKQLKIEQRLYTILQILRVTMFEKTPFYRCLRRLTTKKKWVILITNCCYSTYNGTVVSS